MKAQPLIINDPLIGFEECSIEQATHLKIKLPGPTGILVLPVIRSGSREGTPCWSWNGDVDRPTLRPSISSRIEWLKEPVVCHCFVDDGLVQFLDDSTHSLAGQTVPLLDIEAALGL